MASERDREQEEHKRASAVRKWATTAAARLLREAASTHRSPRREHLFSARIEHPRSARYRVPVSDDESIETNLSLFSCSTEDGFEFDKSRSKRRKRRKRKTVEILETDSAPSQKIDWQEIERNSKPSLLNKMLDRDASNMSSYCSGYTAPTRQTLYDVISDHERALLQLTQTTAGICGVQKSSSTENLISSYEMNQQIKLPPRFWLQRFKERGRPKSAPSDITSCRYQNEISTTPNQHFSQDSLEDFQFTARTHPLQRSHITFSSLPDFETQKHITNEGKRRVKRAVTALGRLTGHSNSSAAYSESIKNDYAKTPIYSHSVIITHQLRNIIEKDIRARMGFRRQNGITKTDMIEFDAKQPKLGRTHRNLLIFNWLSTIDEHTYVFDGEPEIREIEEESPKQVTYRMPLVTLRRGRRPYTQESACAIHTDISMLTISDSTTHARQNIMHASIPVL